MSRLVRFLRFLAYLFDTSMPAVPVAWTDADDQAYATEYQRYREGQR